MTPNYVTITIAKSQTLFIDEKIANHATNMMIINNIAQACLCYFSII
jgi:hypothetical protein